MLFRMLALEKGLYKDVFSYKDIGSTIKNLSSRVKGKIKSIYKENCSNWIGKLKEYCFIKPALGVWIGIFSADKDDENGKGGMILGNYNVEFGGLGGLTVGVGKKFGVYTGIVGGVSFLPLLTTNFIGLPIGVHYKRKYGLGVIVPYFVDWKIALGVGIASVGLSLVYLAYSRVNGDEVLDF